MAPVMEGFPTEAEADLPPRGSRKGVARAIGDNSVEEEGGRDQIVRT